MVQNFRDFLTTYYSMLAAEVFSDEAWIDLRLLLFCLLNACREVAKDSETDVSALKRFQHGM